MPVLFQITGSSSFAARAALEEAGVAYDTVDIAPKDRSGPPAFVDTTPTRRVPALEDDGVKVFETAAILLYLTDRYPDAKLGPAPGHPDRGDYVSWMVWAGNAMHTGFFATWSARWATQIEEAQAQFVAHAVAQLHERAALLEARLQGRDWLVGDSFTLVDSYVYMLVGWQHYFEGMRLGGDALQAHYTRVGARPAIARARELDDLDERLIRTAPSEAAPKG